MEFDVDSASFMHNGVAVRNPTVSDCGRFEVSPEVYGFYVESTGGGATAWVKEFDNGFLVIDDYDCNHVLGEGGSPMLMCFYDGSADDMWGKVVICLDLQVGIIKEAV